MRRRNSTVADRWRDFERAIKGLKRLEAAEARGAVTVKTSLKAKS